jgi:hypothetical protein
MHHKIVPNIPRHSTLVSKVVAANLYGRYKDREARDAEVAWSLTNTHPVLALLQRLYTTGSSATDGDVQPLLTPFRRH